MYLSAEVHVPTSVEGPVWVAGSYAVLGIIIAAVKVYRHVARTRAEGKVSDAKATAEIDKIKVETQATVRRSEATEAWEVVDRLSAEVEKNSDKIEKVEKECEKMKEESDRRERAANARASQCEKEHAGTKSMLKVVLAWAKRRNMPMTAEMERLITDPGVDSNGSGIHTPLEGPSQ